MGPGLSPPCWGCSTAWGRLAQMSSCRSDSSIWGRGSGSPPRCPHLPTAVGPHEVSRVHPGHLLVQAPGLPSSKPPEAPFSWGDEGQLWHMLQISVQRRGFHSRDRQVRHLRAALIRPDPGPSPHLGNPGRTWDSHSRTHPLGLRGSPGAPHPHPDRDRPSGASAGPGRARGAGHSEAKAEALDGFMLLSDRRVQGVGGDSSAPAWMGGPGGLPELPPCCARRGCGVTQ